MQKLFKTENWENNKKESKIVIWRLAEEELFIEEVYEKLELVRQQEKLSVIGA